MGYFGNLFTQAKADILALDDTENVVLGGQVGQSISRRSALAAKRGNVIGCAVCAFLSLAVQKNHCKDTLNGVPMALENDARAAFWLTALAAFMLAVPGVAIALLIALFR